MITRKGWKTTGWQGITMQTPPEWNLVGYGGDARSGNMRLDNADLHGHGALGLEVRWSPIKGKSSQDDLEKRLSSFFAGIAKSAKKQKTVAESKSKPVEDPRRPERDASRSFSWRSDRRAVGRIWHCTECGRLVVAQVLGTPRDEFAGTAQDVLQSMECHPSEVGWQTWSLYDLLTQLPADYSLLGQPQLMNIYVQLQFGLGQSLDTINVEQWGVANVQLRGAYLDEWFQKKNASQDSSVSYEGREATVQGHPALALTGRRGGLHYWSSKAVPQLFRLQKPATYFEARLWECPESNKIHLVQRFSRRPDADLVEEIAGRTQCHC